MLEVILGLLLGAAVQYLAGEYKLRKEFSRTLVTKYLILLQDAAESLYHRIKNINEMGGRNLMDTEYFSTSTLYSISKLLAVDLVLLRDGVYANPMTDREIVLAVKDITSAIHREFDRDIFLRYHRIELAEACMDKDGLSGWHDFRIRVNGSEYKEAITSYQSFLKKYPKIQTENLLNKLVSLVNLLENKTKVPASIRA